MGKQFYYRTGRTMIVFTGLGMILATTFAVVAIAERDWHLLPIFVAGFALNFMVAGIAIADGVKRFGNRHHGR